jgi:regulator of protease activity HflC (stomatin/prohibitin superfamily)
LPVLVPGKLILGLPPETLRIAAQTLEYIESNAQPVIHPGDDFLASFSKDDSIEPVMDTITQTHHDEEEVEELHEVVELEDENTEVEDDVAEPQLYARILSDKEKRKMEKVQAKNEKDAEKVRKKAEKEALKAGKEKEKADRKLRAIIPKLQSIEIPGSAEG